MDDEKLNINLNEIWRTCRKIQAGIFRYGINLWDYFKPHDPNNNGLISDSRFNNVLGQVKNLIGVSETEIREITDYFRQRDGRIAYEQFCETICEEGQNHSRRESLATGLEWNDPMHVNVISSSEERRLCVLLTKIAQTVRIRDLVLMPYFQDYELVAKNVGTVTVSHFSRILHFMKIILSEDDFLLLLKRYMKNSYTVNYIAFVKHINEIGKYLDSQKMMDNSQDVIANFPGRLIDAELPKLPRPEIGKVNVAEVLGEQASFHPALQPKRDDLRLAEIKLRIQRHVHENRIRLYDFFEAFDPLRTGFITKNQFLRCLDIIGISGLHRLHLTENELEVITHNYADNVDSDRVNWRAFKADTDRVFTEPDLEKKPFLIVTIPPDNITDLPRRGQTNWHEEKPRTRDLCEDALHTIHKKIESRRIYLHPFFKDFDKLNLGHVSRTQARQVLFSNGILLSNEEFYALEKRYSNDVGFNYSWFLQEADPVEYPLPKATNQIYNAPVVQKNKDCLHKTEVTQQEIINAIAHVKRQAVTKQVRIVDFIKDYDRHKEDYVPEEDFRRGLDNANIKLNAAEMNIICEIFKTPLRDGFILYKQFCKVIEEVFVQANLERAPLIVPLQHYPCTECFLCFLNFDERAVVTKALQKLAKKPDLISNIVSVFQDYDKVNCGTISQNQFLRALTVRDLHNAISSREFATICKCFGVERGLQMEVDYRAFLRTLDILFANRMKYPF